MIQTIFGSPVIVLKPDNIKNLFSEEMCNNVIEFLMQDENKFVNHSDVRGNICTTDFNLTLNSNKSDQFNLLINFLREIGLKYANLYSTSDVKDLKFSSMWINLSFQGCEIRNHDDKYEDNEEKTLIILYYPKVPKNSSNLVFIHNSEYREWSDDRPDRDLVKITIEEETVIIIDSFVLHAVDKHNSPETRMCMGFKFKLEK